LVTVMLGGQVMERTQLDLMTVTVKLQLVVVPQASLAVAMTVVVPMGNVLPLGGMAVKFKGVLHPPVAETVKNTATPLELVVVTVILVEQSMAMGGRTTVTLKEQLVKCPQVSLAVAVTMVVPTGKALPLGGLAITLGVLQPPEAVTVKNTTAPLVPVAVTVMLVEQSIERGGELETSVSVTEEELLAGLISM